MESRKGTLSALKRCRFCLSQEELTSLYKRNKLTKNAVSLPLKIMSCVSVEVYPSDKMPTYICSRCKYFMDIFYEFKNICRQADENILQFIESGNQLESITWPSILAKTFFSQPKQPEVAVMKTVVESGATVQLTTQDLSDTDMEDDENVYNIKIGDGSDDESKSARIKVITGSDKEDASKRKLKKTRKGHATVSKLAKHVRSHAGERAYPCKYCDKNFAKSHHYTRHLRMKHREVVRSRRGPFGEQEQQYRCDQCDDSFSTQDELIYHSAIHATQNLICPLCQEKFADVDAVTAHIKSHVNGTEFMCDYCELIFTTKEKLDKHVSVAHEDELRSDDQGESSIELDGDDDEDDAINVTEENGEMVVEIKKADDFMITNYQGESEDKVDITNSDDSEAEDTETTTTEPVEAVKIDPKPSDVTITKLSPSSVVSKRQSNNNTTKTDKTEDPPASIIRKFEEMKRKSVQHKTPCPVPKKKEKINKVDGNNSGGNDKSLRLLEKELQDLKRTNSRTETLKTPTKHLDTLKNRKLQIHTSTPKPRPVGVKESQQVLTKTIDDKKKIPERRLITKENKEINKDVKEQKNNNIKEDKEKDVTDKEPPQPPKEKNMNNVKNGSNNKNSNEEVVRRSTRPSKIKDYAKMIRDSSQDSAESSDESEDDDEDDEEFTKIERSPEPRPKQRRASIKQQPTPKPATVTNITPVVPRKRGRPRKDAQHVPTKVRKECDEEKEDAKSTKPEQENTNTKESDISMDQDNDSILNTPEPSTSEADPSTSGTLASPAVQTLKKVPIKALPHGVKPFPLPVNARLGSGEVCEMQIGKKLVKVQKIVMTKAEVEEMTKKGLVEMKDGTMVLKQGVNPSAVKSSLVGEGGEAEKESPSKKDKATPTRCDFGDET